MTDEEIVIPDVPAEVIELNGHLLLQLTMNSGDQYGIYIGRLDDEDLLIRPGSVEYGTKFVVPEGHLSWVEAYKLAEELSLEPVSFGEYTADIRCSEDWGRAYAIMDRKKEAIRATMPPRYELARTVTEIDGSDEPEEVTRLLPKKVDQSVKVPRPAWFEAVKDAGQLHTDELVIDARHVDDTVEIDGVYVPVGELGIAGKLVVVRYGFDKAGKPSVSFEQDDDKQRVSINPDFVQEIDPTQLLGTMYTEAYGARCTGKYAVGEDRRVDLETTVSHGVTAMFKPGFVGVIGTGGAYRSKAAPSVNMAYCGQRNIAFRLPQTGK